jgi:hypothetical protein
MVDQPQKKSDDTWTYTVVAVMIGFILIIGYVFFSSIDRLDLVLKSLGALIITGGLYFGVSQIIKVYRDEDQRRLYLSGRWFIKLITHKKFIDLLFNPWLYVAIVIIFMIVKFPEATIGLLLFSGFAYVFVKVFGRPKTCPKCDSSNIKVVKSGLWRKYTEASMQLWTMGIRKMTPNLNVCRDCGFSWEDR